jgi:hypothetical protein
MTRPTTVVNVRGMTDADLEREGVVYVGRPTRRAKAAACRKGHPLGNPFVGEGALDRYIDHVLSRPDLLALLPALKGRALGCWCGSWRPGEPDLMCHATIIAMLIEDHLEELTSPPPAEHVQ